MTKVVTDLTIERILAAMDGYKSVGSSASAPEYNIFLSLQRQENIDYAIPRRAHGDGPEAAETQVAVRFQACISRPLDLDDVPCSFSLSSAGYANPRYGPGGPDLTAPRVIGHASFVAAEGFDVKIWASPRQVSDFLWVLAAARAGGRTEAKVGVTGRHRWKNVAGQEMVDFDVVDVDLSIRTQQPSENA